MCVCIYVLKMLGNEENLVSHVCQLQCLVNFELNFMQMVFYKCMFDSTLKLLIVSKYNC